VKRILLACFAFLLASGFEAGAEAFYCQNRLVIVGDAQARVRSLCGDPASISERVVSRTQRVYVRVNGAVVADEITVSEVIEFWVYDFGPRRFMQELQFSSGRLRSIEALGYGTEVAAMRVRHRNARSFDLGSHLAAVSVRRRGSSLPPT
jgi:hypothetical protein